MFLTFNFTHWKSLCSVYFSGQGVKIFPIFSFMRLKMHILYTALIRLDTIYSALFSFFHFFFNKVFTNCSVLPISSSKNHRGQILSDFQFLSITLSLPMVLIKSASTRRCTFIIFSGSNANFDLQNLKKEEKSEDFRICTLKSLKSNKL